MRAKTETGGGEGARWSLGSHLHEARAREIHVHDIDDVPLHGAANGILDDSLVASGADPHILCKFANSDSKTALDKRLLRKHQVKAEFFAWMQNYIYFCSASVILSFFRRISNQRVFFAILDFWTFSCHNQDNVKYQTIYIHLKSTFI